jgi:hypothetical protein
MPSAPREHQRKEAAAHSVDVAATPLLDPGGARVVLGSRCEDGVLVSPIAPTAHTLFAPRGACLDGADGPLIVCDTGHHRLLCWNDAPICDHVPADLVIGQPGFTGERRNAGGTVGATTLNVPTGVAAKGGMLAVADAWNHRVLLWHDLPRRSNQPADVVVGQPDFASASANHGERTPTAATLNWCYGVAIHDGRLFVADTGNRRVLVWDTIPQRSGAAADLVLGQAEFGTRDEEAGAGPGPVGMRWPHAIVLAGGMLFVADAGSSRVMGWRGLPSRSGAACDFVLGQIDASGADHNRSRRRPTAATLNMPYGVTSLGGLLVVADTANSRLLGFDLMQLSTGAPAIQLSGQRTFEDAGDNRWVAPSRDSLCWPYAVAAAGNRLAVADSGNNRVLLWDKQ